MSLPSYLTCAGGMGGQILRASSISSTLGRSHCTLFCSPVLQMWSRRAARIARPRSLSPLLMHATATSKAASFSRRAPKFGMIFTASTPFKGRLFPRFPARVLPQQPLSTCHERTPATAERDFPMQLAALSRAMWRGYQLYSPWYLNNTIRVRQNWMEISRTKGALFKSFTDSACWKLVMLCCCFASCISVFISGEAADTGSIQ